MLRATLSNTLGAKQTGIFAHNLVIQKEHQHYYNNGRHAVSAVSQGFQSTSVSSHDMRFPVILSIEDLVALIDRTVIRSRKYMESLEMTHQIGLASKGIS